MENTPDILLFFGRFHPILVHLPIGFLLLASIAHFFSIKEKYASLVPYVKTLWGIGAASAFFSALVGYFLSFSGDYDETTLQLHQWLGIGVFVFSTLSYFIASRSFKGSIQLNSFLSVLVLIVLTVTGHLGGNLTHGEEYLVEYAPDPIRNLAGFPDKPVKRPKVTQIDSAHFYLDVVNPIMVAKCVSCHNDSKTKGGLNLTTYQKILKGGKNKNTIIPGEVDKSELIRRVTLPETHEEFMPSEGKRPLSNEELKLVEWWVEVNAPEQGYFLEYKPTKELLETAKSYFNLLEKHFIEEFVNPLSNEQVTAIEQQGFIVNRLMKDNNYIEVKYGFDQKPISEEAIKSLIAVKDHIIWLSLPNAELNDEMLKTIGSFNTLMKLNLSSTSLPKNSLEHLVGLNSLESLNLYDTDITNETMKELRQLKNLKRLYIAKTNTTEEGISELKNQLEDLKVVYN